MAACLLFCLYCVKQPTDCVFWPAVAWISVGGWRTCFCSTSVTRSHDSFYTEQKRSTRTDLQKLHFHPLIVLTCPSSELQVSPLFSSRSRCFWAEQSTKVSEVFQCLRETNKCMQMRFMLRASKWSKLRAKQNILLLVLLFSTAEPCEIVGILTNVKASMTRKCFC